MLTLLNICIKYISRVITVNKKDTNCLLNYIPNTLYCEVAKYRKLVVKRKNKRHRRACKRLAVRYINKIRARYGRLDIDFPQFV